MRRAGSAARAFSLHPRTPFLKALNPYRTFCKLLIPHEVRDLHFGQLEHMYSYVTWPSNKTCACALNYVTSLDGVACLSDKLPSDYAALRIAKLRPTSERIMHHLEHGRMDPMRITQCNPNSFKVVAVLPNNCIIVIIPSRQMHQELCIQEYTALSSTQ